MSAYYIFPLLLLYMAVMLYLGYYGFRKVKKISDYTAALSSYGPFPVALAFAAVWSSAVTYIGVPGFIYGIGPAGAHYSYLGMAGTVIATALATYYFRNMIEKLRPLSLFDYLGQRFQSNTVAVLAAITYAIGIIFFAASALTGGGHVLSVVLDWPYQWGLLLTAGICLAYIYFGGTHGTTLTSIVQASVMCITSIVIFLIGFVFLYEGGISEVFARMAAQDEAFSASHLISPVDQMFMVPSLIGIFIGHVVYAYSPHVAKNVLMLQSQRQVLPFLLWTTLIMSVMILAVWGGAGARAYLADPNLHPDASLPTFIMEAFHPLVAALLCVAIFSAAMSSFGPMVLAWAITITNDIVKTVFSKRANEISEKKQFIFTRALLVLATGFCLAIAWEEPPYLILLMWAGFGASIAGVGPSAMLSTMWKGTTSAGAITSNIVGVLSFLAGFLVLQWTPFEAAAFAVPLSFLALVLVSLFTTPPPAEHVEHLFTYKE